MKKVKRAQNGKQVVTERKLMPKWIDTERKRMTSAAPVNLMARRAAIKRGDFIEDPRTGDIFPTKAYGVGMRKGGKLSKKKK